MFLSLQVTRHEWKHGVSFINNDECHFISVRCTCGKLSWKNQWQATQNPEWLWMQIVVMATNNVFIKGHRWFRRGGSNLHAQSRFLVSVICFIRINWSYSSPLDYLLAPLARAKHQTPNILVDHWGMDEIVLNWFFSIPLIACTRSVSSIL